MDDLALKHRIRELELDRSDTLARLKLSMGKPERERFDVLNDKIFELRMELRYPHLVCR